MGDTQKDEAAGPEDLKELGRAQANLNPVLLSPWESSPRGRGDGQGRWQWHGERSGQGGGHETGTLLRRKKGGPCARLSLRILFKERKESGIIGI